MIDPIDPTAHATLRKAFLDSTESVRPLLHRYCSRMVGSILDGEDIVQDVLAAAYFNLPTLQDPAAIQGWMFRIAHNKCLDFLRKRRPDLEEASVMDNTIYGDQNEDVPLERIDEVSSAFAHVLDVLAPQERGALLLKDALGYSLTECSVILETSTGAIKSALRRARRKLQASQRDASQMVETQSPLPRERTEELVLLQTYVDRFNARDVEGIKQLIRHDARLEIVSRFEGVGKKPIAETYFVNYGKLPGNVQLRLAMLDNEVVIVGVREDEGGVIPVSAVRVDIRDGVIHRIRDYIHVGYVFDTANNLSFLTV